jgi:heptosyltransferase-2
MPLPSTIKHLTILFPSWVGDVVMASCVWQMARKKFPDATITAAIRPQLASLLDGVEEIDEVLPFDMKSSVFVAAKKLRAINSDSIILLPNSIRSALIARLARIPIRAGYKRDGRSWLLTLGVTVDQQHEPTPTSGYYLNLANELFEMQESPSLPTIGISDAQHAKALNILKGISSPIVLLVVGASKSQKRWNPKHFATVADALHDMGATCCAIGSPDEQALIQEVVHAATAPIHDFTQSGMTLGTLKGVVQKAALMITNDTGPRHLAIASGTPTIALYGPTDFRWTKYACNHDVAVLADPFLPTNLVADDNPTRCEINNIPPSDVIAIAKQLLT